MRTFVGNGFSLPVPDAWEDLTLYSLRGPEDEGHVHRIWVHLDADPGTDDVHEFAERHVDRMVESTPGAIRLRLDPATLASGIEGRLAEIRWTPRDAETLYGRLFFALHEGTGYSVTSHLTKRSRETLGPAIAEIVAGFRPGPPGATSSEPSVLRLGAFSIPLAAGWEDESTYVVAAPPRLGFRPNAIVTRRQVGFPDDSLQDLARADIADSGLEARGFEPTYEGFARMPDRGFSYRCVFRKDFDDSGSVRQDQQFLLRHGVLYLLSLTTAWERDGAEASDYGAMLDGFAVTADAAGTR